MSEVEGVKLNEVYDTSDEDAAARRQFASQCLHDDPQKKYVIKVLRTDLSEEEHTKGIVDLAIEANFLETISHPNIITMRSMANSDPYENRFFVILDRLTMTLERKMNSWRGLVSDHAGVWMGPCCGYCFSDKDVLYRLWMERIIVARDICSAVYYLHMNDIVYRDLKPDNVGFNSEGKAMIFDFGLAKRLEPMDKTDDGLYRMTGNTGSLRYMAPEVANCLPYDTRVDAYSFGILFWQICSLTTPFAGYTTKTHAEYVLRQGRRPKPDPTWPLTWTELMESCWSSDVNDRPDFDYIVRILDEEVAQMTEEEGVVPTRASDIRAKKRRKKVKKGGSRLDVDTRLSTGEDVSVKRFDVNVV